VYLNDIGSQKITRQSTRELENKYFFSSSFFSIIIPSQRGGATTEENLWQMIISYVYVDAVEGHSI